jgi:hypothetical protein
VVGVFVSFTLSQFSMILHWSRLLKNETDALRRSKMIRSRVVNAVGFVMTSIVLVIVLITKFTHGAYITIIAMILLWVFMKRVHAYYESTEKQIEVSEKAGDKAKPARVSRIHAIVLVSKLTKPALRALTYAKITHPATLEALMVDTDTDATKDLQKQWVDKGIKVPLRILASPYREITRPVAAYVGSIRKRSEHDLVVVYVPEYAEGIFMENLMHNRTALRIKERLRFIPGVIIASVPWQLSKAKSEHDKESSGPGEHTNKGAAA